MLEGILVFVLIAGAAAYLCRGFFRKGRKKPADGACGGGCGCTKGDRL